MAYCAQRKNKFYRTIKYPRLLLLFGVKELIENYEGFACCAPDAWWNKAGHELPLHEDIRYASLRKICKEALAFLKYPEPVLPAW